MAKTVHSRIFIGGGYMNYKNSDTTENEFFGEVVLCVYKDEDQLYTRIIKHLSLYTSTKFKNGRDARKMSQE